MLDDSACDYGSEAAVDGATKVYQHHNYAMIDYGSCDSNGMLSISSASVCTIAAMSLRYGNLYFGQVVPTNPNPWAPFGCNYDPFTSEASLNTQKEEVAVSNGGYLLCLRSALSVSEKCRSKCEPALGCVGVTELADGSCKVVTTHTSDEAGTGTWTAGATSCTSPDSLVSNAASPSSYVPAQQAGRCFSHEPVIDVAPQGCTSSESITSCYGALSGDGASTSWTASAGASLPQYIDIGLDNFQNVSSVSGYITTDPETRSVTELWAITAKGFERLDVYMGKSAEKHYIEWSFQNLLQMRGIRLITRVSTGEAGWHEILISGLPYSYISPPPPNPSPPPAPPPTLTHNETDNTIYADTTWTGNPDTTCVLTTDAGSIVSGVNNQEDISGLTIYTITGPSSLVWEFTALEMYYEPPLCGFVPGDYYMATKVLYNNPNKVHRFDTYGCGGAARNASLEAAAVVAVSDAGLEAAVGALSGVGLSSSSSSGADAWRSKGAIIDSASDENSIELTNPGSYIEQDVYQTVLNLTGDVSTGTQYALRFRAWSHDALPKIPKLAVHIDAHNGDPSVHIDSVRVSEPCPSTSCRYGFDGAFMTGVLHTSESSTMIDCEFLCTTLWAPDCTAFQFNMTSSVCTLYDDINANRTAFGGGDSPVCFQKSALSGSSIIPDYYHEAYRSVVGEDRSYGGFYICHECRHDFAIETEESCLEYCTSESTCQFAVYLEGVRMDGQNCIVASNCGVISPKKNALYKAFSPSSHKQQCKMTHLTTGPEMDTAIIEPTVGLDGKSLETTTIG
ncbi:hypothetical protein CYMTET_20385 [Cymbomonas tetramitiformis]|uniref:Apple domain-containing protein n=1 Tax=Cymbomonas tetramitiformis TaxID=36881 RepID=A0AAE0G432_9CHLO|nr:hypothetical protein CYMTET_20385 [Cymbomonas tetramitiformis]